MTLVPHEIVLDTDILALDSRATEDFGSANEQLVDKRQIAVGQWIAGRLTQHGYPVHRHRVRRAPDAVIGQVSSVTTDYTSEATNATEGDVPLGTVFTGGDATDALYVMYRAPFRGVYVGVTEAPNAVAAASSPTVWTGAFTGVRSLTDHTLVAGASFARGGLVSWQLSEDWGPRVFTNTFGYWAKFYVSSLTATTTAAQVLPVVPSKLTYPAALYTLGLLYQGAWASQRGDWADKSDRLFGMAEQELTRVIGSLGDEFDVDATGAVEVTEVNSFRQTEDAASLSQWERA